MSNSRKVNKVPSYEHLNIHYAKGEENGLKGQGIFAGKQVKRLSYSCGIFMKIGVQMRMDYACRQGELAFVETIDVVAKIFDISPERAKLFMEHRHIDDMAKNFTDIDGRVLLKAYNLWRSKNYIQSLGWIKNIEWTQDPKKREELLQKAIFNAPENTEDLMKLANEVKFICEKTTRAFLDKALKYADQDPGALLELANRCTCINAIHGTIFVDKAVEIAESRHKEKSIAQELSHILTEAMRYYTVAGKKDKVKQCFERQEELRSQNKKSEDL